MSAAANGNDSDSKKLKSEEVDLNKLLIGICQIHVDGKDKAKNLVNASNTITDLVKQSEGKCKLVCLPECFNSEYATLAFPKNAEIIPSKSSLVDADKHPSTYMLITTAKELGIYIIGGSIPEQGDDGKVYNTCIVVDPQGEILLKHRKVHLFDIDVPGGIKFKESDTLSAGNCLSSFDTPYGKIGVGICYDIRFPEYAMALRQQGCFLIVYPGAFNMTTGPAHWELLQRARALDNQMFIATVSPARDETASYRAWGHSTVINPWGEVIATCEHEPKAFTVELDIPRVQNVRNSIPVFKQHRTDLYDLVHWKNQENGKN